MVNWCSRLSWHIEDILYSPEWSGLSSLVSQREIPEYDPCPTSEHICSSRCPHLLWFSREKNLKRQPSAHTGSGLLDFGCFYILTPHNYIQTPHIFVFCQRGTNSLLFSLFENQSLYQRISLTRGFLAVPSTSADFLCFRPHQ